MVSAPGSGHQSANLRMIQRLRELGFNGRIQVIYEDGVASKLSFLVPGFNSADLALQRIDSKELGAVEFVAQSQAAEALQERMKVTFSGARDEATSAFHRHKMNSDYFVQLQPKRWFIRGAERGIFTEGKKEVHRLDHLSGLGPLTFTGEAQTLAEQVEKVKLVPGKGEALAQLLKASPNFDWMPAYSIDFTKDPEDLMETIVKGVRAAAKSPKFKQPIVIPILTELEPFEAEEFSQSMKKIGAPVTDLLDPNLTAKIARGKPGEVFLVQVGRLPPQAFDAVISRATLPVILEGKNLTQSALERGLPFLNVTGSLTDIQPELQAKGVDAEAAGRIRQAFYSLDYKQPNNTPARTTNSLARFFEAAKGGKVAEFFSAQRVEPGSVERDLTARALIELKQVMQTSQPQAITTAPTEPCAPQFQRLLRRGPTPMNRGRGFN